jgi:hypothetical protein
VRRAVPTLLYAAPDGALFLGLMNLQRYRAYGAKVITLPFILCRFTRKHRLTQSARGLAHSKTLRAVRAPSEFAPASWSAAALRRFSPCQSHGVHC